ncbi:MAG: EI24 domain-containing protein [Candidatus Uhrbacteria bacterium]|nr:EI24 domain-containing protein [Patescibacteria group bacterium]MBU1906820.1 EI24 domain-containing protein [Patescibacteria group bacterium]
MNQFFLGFSFLWKGFVCLAHRRNLWWLVIVPLVINVVLLVLLILGVIWLSRYWLAMSLPEVWWATMIAVIAISAATVLILFLGIILFATVGTIIGAPFYEQISYQVDDNLGGFEVEVSWWKQIVGSLKNSLKRIYIFGLVQVALLILLVIPFIVGIVTYTVLGFIATTFFLSLEYLDFVFERRQVSFHERLRWGLDRKWFVGGFGVALFVGLTIPLVNLLVPPAAAVGAVLMYHALSELKGDSDELIEPLTR